MLTGQNGILNRAGEASEKTRKETAREQIQLEVIGTYDVTGNIDVATLKTNLETNLGADATGVGITLPTGKISLNGYDFMIDSNGNVLDYEKILQADGSWNAEKEVNSPKLSDGMTAVYWDNSGNEVKYYNEDGTKNENFDVDAWYDYIPADDSKAGTTAGDTKTSYWANAITEDGSYWVWIPRFAYKITSTTTDYTTAGTIDVVFLQNTTNNCIDENITPVMPTSSSDTTSTYVVHPAFCGTGYEDLGGGFGTDENGISGFWVAKYEMSMEGSADNGNTWSTLVPTRISSTTAISGNVATTNMITEYNNENNASLTTSVTDGTTTYSNIRAVSKANVSSWRYINISNCYENAYYYDRTKDSHLMKNSEWGAVAYLTHSKYGRNGNEITINEDSTYTSASKGVNTSTTGNIYGIYDLSGSAYEYVAGFNDKCSNSETYYSKTSSSYSSATGNNMGATGLANSGSTKYLTAYSNSSSLASGSTVSTICKIGDAIKDVWVSSYYGWFSDFSVFVGSGSPFFMRGGSCNNSSNAGIFCSYCVSGNTSDSSSPSFRVVFPV